MKVETVQDIIGTMNGHRAILFNFETNEGKKLNVTFDFYGAGSAFNGAAYCRIEAAALRSVVRAGHEVKTFSHRLVPLR